MNILDRLEEIRLNERLNKKEFEKIIDKSSGYINSLRKNQGIPGSDVLIKISEYNPNYNINWLLTGQGKMMKDPKSEFKASDEAIKKALSNTNLSHVHKDIKEDLKVIHESLISATETLSEGMFYNLKEQQKIITFIEKLSAEEINDATKNLNKFLESQK
jgi:transcriptional regulator with XRE-family HTH domain